ncbi:glycosyltransferase family 4 protein [Gaetbulibacter sp. M235]|uniref:glycosyltransferase family 4 protein n=1 Tax=Gaetbulibacter sp. M235 TaxID=3126510 RepID=UPI00374F48B5
MENNFNIALFSPNKDPYSETFIQAHKKGLKGNIFFYYGIGEDITIENHPPLASKLKKQLLKAIKIIFKKNNSFVLVKLLSKSLKKHKIDVVLVEYGIHADHILPAIKYLNLPLVVHFHGFDATVRKIIKEHNSYKEVFQYASKIIAVSKAMENQLLNIGCPREKLIYNANAAQSNFINIESSYESKQLISVGRFANKKAPYYTILAFKKALKTHPDAKLLMCGDGLLLEVCKNLVRHYQLESSIQFLGVISPNELCNLFKESIGYIQHSITAENGDTEGMPISILEASSSGLPVISTFHAGISDVIEDGITGLLCKEHDVDAMSQNIIKLLDDKDYAKKLGYAGKERIKSHFSFEKHINGIQQILEESVNHNM